MLHSACAHRARTYTKSALINTRHGGAIEQHTNMHWPAWLQTADSPPCSSAFSAFNLYMLFYLFIYERFEYVRIKASAVWLHHNNSRALWCLGYCFSSKIELIMCALVHTKDTKLNWARDTKRVASTEMPALLCELYLNFWLVQYFFSYVSSLSTLKSLRIRRAYSIENCVCRKI